MRKLKYLFAGFLGILLIVIGVLFRLNLNLKERNSELSRALDKSANERSEVIEEKNIYKDSLFSWERLEKIDGLSGVGAIKKSCDIYPNFPQLPSVKMFVNQETLKSHTPQQVCLLKEGGSLFVGVSKSGKGEISAKLYTFSDDQNGNPTVSKEKELIPMVFNGGIYDGFIFHGLYSNNILVYSVTSYNMGGETRTYGVSLIEDSSKFYEPMLLERCEWGIGKPFGERFINFCKRVVTDGNSRYLKLIRNTGLFEDELYAGSHF